MIDIEARIRDAMPLPVAGVIRHDRDEGTVYSVVLDPASIPGAPEGKAPYVSICILKGQENDEALIDRRIQGAASTFRAALGDMN